jgi:membrane protein EpsK
MRNRFVINITANIIGFIISLLISMWIIPYYINTLGTEAYSFVPLTQQLISYMDVLVLVLNGMIARFFTVAIKSGKRAEAESYFNTSLFSSLIFSIVIIIPFCLLAIFINKIVVIPRYLIKDVQVCVLMYSVTFILTTVGTSFSMATFCENRLDISSAYNIVFVLIRTILTIIFFNLYSPHIWLIGAGTLVAAIITFLMKIYFFHKLLPDIVVNRTHFNLGKLKELISSSMWNSIYYLGTLFFLQIDMLVANWYLGPKIAGEYSAVVQWSSLLRSFVGTITSVFAPMITILYAQHKMDDIVSYSNYAIKVTGLFMALPVGIICGFGGDLLKLWLGKGFIQYGPLLTLMTFHLSVNLAVQSLFSLFTAVNRIKLPAFINLFMGATNFVLAILLTHTFSLGTYGIALAGAISLTAKNLIFTPIYSAVVTEQKWFVYYKGIIKPFFGVLAIVLFSLLLRSLWIINHWTDMFIQSGSVVLIYIMFTYTFLLSSEDKKKVKTRLNYWVQIIKKICEKDFLLY